MYKSGPRVLLFVAIIMPFDLIYSRKAIAIMNNDGAGVSWPICSTQYVDLTGYRQPVNVSVSVNDGTATSSLATNLTTKVYPIEVK